MSSSPGSNNSNNNNNDNSSTSSSKDASAKKPKNIYELLPLLQKQTPPRDGVTDSQRKLRLNDVISSMPAEQGAETKILQDLESKIHEQDDEHADVEKLADLIATTPDDDEDDEEDQEEAKDVVAELRPRSDSFDGVSVLSGGDQVPSSPRQKGAASPGAAKSKFRGLVRSHMMQQQQEHASVEQSLFGLTRDLARLKAAQGEDENDRSSRSFSRTTNLMKQHSSSSDLEAPPEDSTTEEATDTDSTRNNPSGKKGGRHHKKKNNLLQQDVDLVKSFLSPRKDSIKKYLKHVVLFILIPSAALSALFFYGLKNPFLEDKIDAVVRSVNGTDNDAELANTIPPSTTDPEAANKASISWWLLFLGVRQVLTFSMALATQALVVDFLALGTRLILKFCGPVITMFLVQSKGWPFVMTFWAVYDLLLLQGDTEFVKHWLYWQDVIGMFNTDNSAGQVLADPFYSRTLQSAIFVGVTVCIKRFAMAIFLGRHTFAHFGEQLAGIMTNMVLIGEVAHLAKDIEYNADTDVMSVATNKGTSMLNDLMVTQANEEDEEESALNRKNPTAADAASDFMKQHRDSQRPPSSPSRRDILSKKSNDEDEHFTSSEQFQLTELLEAWEEPEAAKYKVAKDTTLGAVLQFRQALTLMEVRYPFSTSFGLADTREHCLNSAQEVYERLMLRTPNQDMMPFETLALLAKKNDKSGGIDEKKAKELIKFFRPGRDGKLTKLEFVKSIDAVYKSIKLLSANIRNNSQIDKAVEKIFNVVFFFILGCIVLALQGLKPMEIFFSFSGAVLAFSFMFGSSAARFLEGILFVLVQKPYGVGDRIHLSDPKTATSIDGSANWIVEKVSLFSTHVYLGATNERATLNNGAIANCRVINAARSPDAQIFVNIKFDIETPYEKIQIFRAAIEQYLKDRPREWISFVAFRPTEVAVDKSYINYVTIAKHRNCWQDAGPVFESKANLMTYELEIAKQLDMRYTMPSVPVDLTMSNNTHNAMQQQLAEQQQILQPELQSLLANADR